MKVFVSLQDRRRSATAHYLLGEHWQQQLDKKKGDFVRKIDLLIPRSPVGDEYVS